ncbi:MAG: hypothetical protein PHY93_17365 [Bacteriovorax sp.]|nr:hypothetical protein [Bacteriovorax sp.]
MNILKLLLLAIIFTFIQSAASNLQASTTKAKGLRYFIISEVQTLQDLFQDQDNQLNDDGSDSDIKASSIALRVMGKAAIGLPNTAQLEFKPSIEVYFRPQ